MSVFYLWMTVCLSMVSSVSSSWFRSVDCSDLNERTRARGPGYGYKVRSFQCNRDGSVECSTREESYSCDDTCTEQGGFRRYESSGELSNNLGGWDCRHECKAGRKGERWHDRRSENCNHYNSKQLYQLDSEGEISCSKGSDCPPPLQDGLDVICHSESGKCREKLDALCHGRTIDGLSEAFCGSGSNQVRYTYGGGDSGSSSRERPSRGGRCRSSHCLAGRWCCPKASRRDGRGKICVYC